MAFTASQKISLWASIIFALLAFTPLSYTVMNIFILFFIISFSVFIFGELIRCRIYQRKGLQFRSGVRELEEKEHADLLIAFVSIELHIIIILVDSRCC